MGPWIACHEKGAKCRAGFATAAAANRPGLPIALAADVIPPWNQAAIFKRF
jgi:hypothetical protein